MIVNTLLVHQDGRVKVNDVILRSRDQITLIEITTSGEFVYTEGIACNIFLKK